ncbi:dynamin superfamily protein, partial [Kipferlia bialata]|eukprot:g1838.t1
MPDVESAALFARFQDSAKPLIALIDRFRELGVGGAGVSLPQVVVIGDQSTGKSSCLEAISGLTLPRGNGICTRCPCELRLKSDPSLTEPICHVSYHKEGGPSVDKQEIDVADLGDSIVEATNKIAGDNK